MKTVTFYHSMICPRCRIAGISLSRLLPEFPNISLEKVEYFTNLGRLRAAGIGTIPSLVSGSKKLSGFYLTKKRIRGFLEAVASESDASGSET